MSPCCKSLLRHYRELAQKNPLPRRRQNHQPPHDAASAEAEVRRFMQMGGDLVEGGEFAGRISRFFSRLSGKTQQE